MMLWLLLAVGRGVTLLRHWRVRLWGRWVVHWLLLLLHLGRRLGVDLATMLIVARR